MKKLYTLLISLILLSYSHAQNYDSLLQNHELTDLKRQSLNLLANSSSRLAEDRPNDTYNIYSANVGFDSEVNYSIYLNTRNKQIEGFQTLDLYFNYSSVNRDSNSPNFRNFDGNTFRFSSSNLITIRNYKGNRFIEYGGSVSHYLNRENSSREQKDLNDNSWNFREEQRSDFSLRTFGTLGAGIGRIERVEDIRHVQFVIERLIGRNKIRQPTNAEVEIIADHFSRLKTKRYYDFRLQNIDQLEEVDSIFQALDLVTESDATYYAVLNDYWEFGNVPMHRGNRISILFRPVYLLENRNRSLRYNGELSSDTKNTEDRYFFTSQINWIFAKPLTPKWQQYLELSLNTFLDPSLPPFNDRTVFLLNHYYDFNPTTRTSARLGYQINYGTTGNQIDSSPGGRIFGNFYYWVSPKFRFYGSLQYEYNQNSEFILEFNSVQNMFLDPDRLNYFQNNEKQYFRTQLGISYTVF